MEHNLQLGFDETIILNDAVEPAFAGERITNVARRGRITYRDFLDVVSDPSRLGALVVLTNSDIMLAPNFDAVAATLRPGELYCFTRHEAAGGQLAEAPWCTQDTWAMLAQPLHNSVLFQAAIPLGRPGCEIRFAEILFSAGYAVYNPCLDVRNVHVHSAPAPHSDADRIYGAYLFTPAVRLGEVRSGRPEHRPTPCYLTRMLPNQTFAIPLGRRV